MVSRAWWTDPQRRKVKALEDLPHGRFRDATAGERIKAGRVRSSLALPKRCLTSLRALYVLPDHSRSKIPKFSLANECHLFKISKIRPRHGHAWAGASPHRTVISSSFRNLCNSTLAGRAHGHEIDAESMSAIHPEGAFDPGLIHAPRTPCARTYISSLVAAHEQVIESLRCVPAKS
jgi:hypothetical protein